MARHGIRGSVGDRDTDPEETPECLLTMSSRRGGGVQGCLNRRLTRVLLALATLAALLYWHLRSSTFGSSFTVQHGPPRAPVTTSDGQFWLEGRPVVLLGGSVHYFRIVPEYWRDRLSRLKAAGLNTVTTYMPWNLHEEVRGEFSFDGILDVRRYIELADELGLHVILRPGPYICSEWDFGGLPSWLLHDPNMRVRTTYAPFLAAADRYLERVAREVSHLQRQNGGPIIAIQVENEYGVYATDPAYMLAVQRIFKKHGLTEFHFTSDNLDGLAAGSLPDTLMTVNFNQIDDGTAMFAELDRRQPTLPRLVAEFWVGWFDTWGGKHQKISTEEATATLKFILGQHSSVNFYMFHGGTNFGFMSGANTPLMPQTTSYDYDSPVTEAGDLTSKYYAIRDVILENFPDVKAKTPQIPPAVVKHAYSTTHISQYMSLQNLLSHVEPQLVVNPISMEMLDVNKKGGQAHGFIVYSHHSSVRGSQIEIRGSLQDRAHILLDSEVLAVLSWDTPTRTVRRQGQPLVGALSILVENLGRINYATGADAMYMNDQRKGIEGRILLDDHELNYWYHYPLEFKVPLLKKLETSKKWVDISVMNVQGPVLLRTYLLVLSEPRDTFLDMTKWGKGVVFVNGRNLGRYWNIGPQRTLYLPGPLLKVGHNEIIIFELHTPRPELNFSSTPLWT